MEKVKRTAKDSVFTALFGQPEYALELYKALHPEDTDVTVDDLEIVTLENILINGVYNDLGMMIRDVTIVLTEAQSTFCRNMPLRCMVYLSDAYKRYVEKHKLSLYSETAVRIPKPELYMIYTGEKRDVPDVLRLSDLYGGEGESVEVEVRVLRRDGSGSILDQYVEFCDIFNAQVKQYGRTAQAAKETIRICLERGILAAFLTVRMEEVMDIMTMLFDQEYVWDIELYNVAKEAEQKGREEGMEKNLLENLRSLIQKLNLSVDQAMDALNVPSETRAKLRAQL